MKIACPKCEWEPPPSARWTCRCGHAWHTFETGGRCPRCGKVWRETQCPACHAWSPHHEWYRGLPPVDALLEAAGAGGVASAEGVELGATAAYSLAPLVPVPL